MPTYEYVCKDCNEHIEVVQSFKDDALTICPACGGQLKKVFGNIGVVFKGSGFYKTDSRSGAKSASTSGKSDSSAKSETSSSSESAKTESSSTPATESTKSTKSESASSTPSSAAAS